MAIKYKTTKWGKGPYNTKTGKWAKGNGKDKKKK